MLARLLHLQGIELIIIENRTRDYIENRIRAGLIEHWAADLLADVGVGSRMQREGMLHWESISASMAICSVSISRSW